MIGNSGKLPGVIGAGDSSNDKLAAVQHNKLGFSPNSNEGPALLEGMVPSNLLGGRKMDKAGAINQISRKNLAVNG